MASTFGQQLLDRKRPRLRRVGGACMNACRALRAAVEAATVPANRALDKCGAVVLAWRPTKPYRARKGGEMMDQADREQLKQTRDTLRRVSRQIEGRQSGHAKAAKPSFDAAAENLNRAIERGEAEPSLDSIEELFPEGDQW